MDSGVVVSFSLLKWGFLWLSKLVFSIIRAFCWAAAFMKLRLFFPSGVLAKRADNAPLAVGSTARLVPPVCVSGSDGLVDGREFSSVLPVLGRQPLQL